MTSHLHHFLQIVSQWLAEKLQAFFHPAPAQHVGMFAGSLLPYEPRE